MYFDFRFNSGYASSCCMKEALRLFTFATRLNRGSQPETGLTAAIYALLALTSYELRRYYLYFTDQCLANCERGTIMQLHNMISLNQTGHVRGMFDER